MEKQALWDETWLTFADLMATKHSKCASKSVACVIVKNEKPISIGLNGTPSGHTNCNEIFWKQGPTFYKNVAHLDDYERELYAERGERLQHEGHTYVECIDQREHHEWSKQNEIHAEINAIGKLASDSTNAEGATAYVTHSPCHGCSLALIAAKISRVVYSVGYEYGDGIELMRKSGIEVVHMPLPSETKADLFR